jgi:lipopolysaccharide export system protein LptC
MRLGGVALFPMAIAAMLAALTFWLEHAIQSDTADHDGKGRHDPDFIIDNMSLKRFDVDGTLQYSAIAPKLIHYADDDSTDITAPAITFHHIPEMKLSARQAWMSKDGKEVRMSGDVLGLRAASQASPEATFSTSVLTIFPELEVARATSRTNLVEGRNTVAGDSFEADNKQKTFSLAGRVSGTLYRQKSQ